MEMRHGMPVWAPTDAELNEIRRRVSTERAKAARGIFTAVQRWFAGDGEAAEAPPAAAKAVARAPYFY